MILSNKKFSHQTALGLELQLFYGSPACQSMLQTQDLYLQNHIRLHLSLYMYAHTPHILVGFVSLEDPD